MTRTTIAVIMLVAGCQTQQGGGGDGFSVDGCRFEEVAGIATIAAVQDAPADFPPVYCPNNPVQVLFDFVADDPDADTEVGSTPGCLGTPCNMGFEPSDIRVVANVEFLEANPAAATLFELVEIPLEDIAAQNVRMRAGESSEEEITTHVSTWQQWGKKLK